MQWNKPNTHLPGVVVVAPCKDNIFNILMGFGTLKQKVWTLMARWILGLTRFSACLLWRLGLTQAKLEESTSCTPSCYGTNLTFAMLTRGLQRSHNLRKFQSLRIEWHDLDALVLSCPGRAQRVMLCDAFNLQFSAYLKLTQAKCEV